MNRPSGVPRLLLVEDDPQVRHSLRLTLSDEGYEVIEAGDGRAAVQALRAGHIDVVLLDILLPDINGVDLCRRLRAVGDMPLIMVTALADSADVVAGLEAGADDYVTKPVVGSELTARVQAVLRRARPTRTPVVTVGDLSIRVTEGTAHRAGRPLRLTRTELRLLAELAAHPGHVVTREQLLERVWGYAYYGDTRLLDVHIRRLRAKVEDDPSSPQLIRTVRGVGYALHAMGDDTY